MTCQLHVPPRTSVADTSVLGVRTGSKNGRAVCLRPNSTQESARAYSRHDVYDLASLTASTEYLTNIAWSSLPKHGPDFPSISRIKCKVSAKGDWVEMSIQVRDSMDEFAEQFELQFEGSCRDDWQHQIPSTCHTKVDELEELCCVNVSSCYSKVQFAGNSSRALRVTTPTWECGSFCNNFTAIRSVVVGALVRKVQLWDLALRLCPEYETPLAFRAPKNLSRHLASYAVTPMFTYSCQRQTPVDLPAQISRLWPMFHMVYSAVFGLIAKTTYNLWGKVFPVGDRT